MINIPTAAEVAANRAAIREKGLDYCLGWIVKYIQQANERGHRNTCFTPTTYIYDDDNGTHYLDLTEELKEILTSKGYKFKPTGYIGGVWQRSEQIVW